ncbi:hypothetical protein [Saccharothrix obliqua]|uniref:hypothetical protein n=1 Tax=Saccharothrix obliqua TaxID=2861747 RepID=UPI001C5D2727|nr:hypothetical protein [Saccharothrix obliqua]MBW4717198.1 hypothetical protein [Saccharothrix obliqua]
MPFIDIVPVGPANAGKSRLLAAMEQGLAEWDAAPAPALVPDPVTALVLSDAGHVADRLVDLWYEARSDGGALFETRLVDYAGAAVADKRHPAAGALAARARSADAVLCVLDGERVAGLLAGDRDGFEDAMAGVWKLVPGRGRAVRFVVTKWDLLEGRASLAGVRRALAELPGFAAVLRRARAGGAALIPVSVVGPDAGAQAVVPLLSVLPQVLRTAAGRVERAGRGGSLVADAGVNWLSQAVTAVAVRRVLQRVVDAVPDSRVARRCAGPAAVGVSMLVEAAVRTWCDRTTRSGGGARPHVEGRLLTRAAEAYEWRLRDFRRRFPDADLTGPVLPRPAG